MFVCAPLCYLQDGKKIVPDGDGNSISKEILKLHPENDVTAILKFRDWACILAEHTEAEL